MRRIILFNNGVYSEYPISDEQIIQNFKFITENQDVYLVVDDTKTKITSFEKCKYGEYEFLAISDNVLDFEKKDDAILIGQENCDIQIKKGKCVIDGEKLFLIDETEIYINGVIQDANEIEFSYGDQILIGCMLIIVHQKYIEIIADNTTYKTNLNYFNKKLHEIEKFPLYQRSPRVVKRLKTDKITIKKPPAKVSRKKNSLIKIIVPPLVMASGTVVMSLTMGRSPFMLFAVAGTIVSLIFSITAYFSDKKEIDNQKRGRKEVYENYLLGIRKTLNKYKNNEVDALKYNQPKLTELEEMIHEFNPRIYEKDVNDDDFLTISVGTSKDISDYTVSFDYDALSTEKDELIDEAKSIYDEYQYIDGKNTTIDLKKAHLGIVGEKHEVHEQLKWIISQITFFHSYHDVQIIMLYNNEFKNEFDYVKWYPHFKIQANNLTGNIYTERVRDQVLGSLNQILKDRKNKCDENKKDMAFFPHFVIIVDDYHMIMNHSIMEYLQKDTTELGFSLIYTAQKRANLPENIKTVLTMEDIDTATLLLNEGLEVNKRLKQQRVNDVDLEFMARDLSIIKHLQGVSSHIPESITFLDMYKAKSLEELNIPMRWENGQSHKSLAVPIGVRGEDDYVELNLHEKAHGPHGLVAGTTGSGKSETLQTYILSLAVNFSPDEVGFLLIDYKGGGMANLFKKLPHLLGTITNLDGAESMRALSSIKAELARRQRIFNSNDVNNINKYNKLFKSGKVQEPLPHLFIISDEFAELKKEQPDFMTELVSVARIGRTLGVHLILATQKPTGVVDDQIWSNSKFKLALKVQDESDSKEIIKTPDAAFITQTGRGYLQVGNNEIYELFQSAWSGATFTSDEEIEKTDDRIYKVNLLGQGELINKDLSDKDESKEVSKSQLDVIVDYIYDYYNSIEHKEITKPWLPSLKKNIANPYIKDVIDTSTITNIDLVSNIGLVDVPEEQKQYKYSVDFNKDGNLAIFSSSGYGKSTTLGNIILSLAIKNNPKLTNFYILDFGNSSLIPYKMLPHVADYMTFDSEEKLSKFKNLILSEIKSRKQLFGKEMVQNFDTYNQIHKDNPLKAIFIVIDNFDVVKELSMEYEESLLKITRDGAGLGIYTIISATRSNAVRFAILNNFKNKIVQYIFDDSDIMNLVGRSNYKLGEEIKGRALIKHKYVSVMQVFSPVKFNDDVEFINNLKELIKNISDAYTGEKLISIPILPDVFVSSDFKNFKNETVGENLVGLSLDNVENISVDLSNSPFVILGPAKSGKTNFLELLMNQAKGVCYVFDTDTMGLYKYKDNSGFKYVSSDEEIKEFTQSLMNEIENRKQLAEKSMLDGNYSSPREYYSTLDNYTIFIDDVDIFIQKVQNITNMPTLLNQAVMVGISVVATVHSNKLKGFDEITKFFKNSTNGVVLGNMGTVTIFQIGMRDIPAFGYGVICENNAIKKIKIPKYVK